MRSNIAITSAHRVTLASCVSASSCVPAWPLIPFAILPLLRAFECYLAKQALAACHLQVEV